MDVSCQSRYLRRIGDGILLKLNRMALNPPVGDNVKSLQFWLALARRSLSRVRLRSYESLTLRRKVTWMPLPATWNQRMYTTRVPRWSWTKSFQKRRISMNLCRNIPRSKLYSPRLLLNLQLENHPGIGFWIGEAMGSSYSQGKGEIKRPSSFR